MSQREQLWRELTRKTPRLLDDPHFTTESVKRFFERVYDAGHRDGWQGAREASRVSATGTSVFEEIFRAQ